VLGRTDSAGRLLFLLVGLAILAGALIVRLGYWQIVERDRLVEGARRQIYVRAEVPSRRGQIYDRSGVVVLASSVTRDRLITSAAELDATERQALAAFLATELELDSVAAGELRTRLESGKPYVVLARDLPPERSQAILDAAVAQGIAGLSTESESARSYPQPGGGPDSSLAAHLIGFVNRDGAGQYGVEQWYDEILAGTPRIVEADRDANGQPLVETERTIQAGEPGGDVRLTIDAGLQAVVEQEVMAAQIADGARTVSAVVMDPYSGQIYAQASYPSYDANDYPSVATEDPGRFVDPVVSQVYEPGSVFKMLTVVAGLETGTTTLRKKYRDSGRLRLADNTRVDDADRRAMGVMTLADGIAYSRNVVAAKVALGLAPDLHTASTTLHEVWRRLGFGSATGVDLAGEVRGLVNDPSISPWREIDLANGSFGQGVAVTQLQLATAFAAMVNGGILVQPHVVAAVDGRDVVAPARGQVLDPTMSPVLEDLLVHVLKSPWYVDEAKVRGYVIGGKTGTAQVWDAEHGRWAFNVYNFSCVGFIARRGGQPDLVVAVRIGEARPARSNAGDLLLPITSTELFRRVATDAIGTPGLLPPLPPEPGDVARTAW
jgi:cell division protein FtsI/penicillin-binding protein 2